MNTNSTPAANAHDFLEEIVMESTACDPKFPTLLAQAQTQVSLSRAVMKVRDER
jgi:hypothetical protein